MLHHQQRLMRRLGEKVPSRSSAFKTPKDIYLWRLRSLPSPSPPAPHHSSVGTCGERRRCPRLVKRAKTNAATPNNCNQNVQNGLSLAFEPWSPQSSHETSTLCFVSVLHSFTMSWLQMIAGDGAKPCDSRNNHPRRVTQKGSKRRQPHVTAK